MKSEFFVDSYESVYVTSHDDTVYVTVTSGDKFTSYLVRDEIIKEISSRIGSKSTHRSVEGSLV